MTRNELSLFVQSYLENRGAGLLSMMDSFIETAEDDISDIVRMPSAKAVVNLNFATGVQTITPPTGLKSVISLSVTVAGEQRFLREVEPDFIRTAYASVSVSGVPSRYALDGTSSILLGPTPDQQYPYRLEYEARPVSLTVQTSGTWLSENCPQALKWGTIVQAYTWMKGDKIVLDEYKEKLAIAVGQLRTQVEGRQRKDSFRNGEPRLPIG